MPRNDLPRELITVEEYLALSAKINYQLSSLALNRQALLALVLGPAVFDEQEQEILQRTFDVMQLGYQQERRRLGTPGILHPLRTAALVARTVDRPSLMHMLVAMLHDKDEDLTEQDLERARWEAMQAEYDLLTDAVRPEEREQLEEAIRLLSARGFGTYQEYLVQILDNAHRIPLLLHIKLADRIDNTLDVHLQHPGVTRYNFYRAVFDILFMPHFRGIQMGSFHFMPDTDVGVMLLSQLFKDTFFLALLRAAGLDTLDDITRRLFIGLAVAGIREAQWLALEIFNTCMPQVEQQRAVLMSVMQYCIEGGAAAVRSKGAGGELDGMLLESFTAAQEGQQKEMLNKLFNDHELLIKLVLAFIVVYASFINDPSYTIAGIQPNGMRPVD
jgi:hypothetical protein